MGENANGWGMVKPCPGGDTTPQVCSPPPRGARPGDWSHAPAWRHPPPPRGAIPPNPRGLLSHAFERAVVGIVPRLGDVNQ